MAKDILILLEHPRVEHLKETDKGVNNVYFSTHHGKVLKAVIKEYAGLDKQEYELDYVYKKIPEALQVKRGKIVKYKPLRIRDVTQEEEYTDEEGNVQTKPSQESILRDQIIEGKPKMVIPTGNLGCKLLVGEASISKSRGIPRQVTLENGNDSHTFWVLPTLSIEYVAMFPNLERHVASDFSTLRKYLKDGDKAFQAQETNYELVTSIERVKEIFNNELDKEYNGETITAWDLETNTLKPEATGAKPLVMTLTWKNGQGVTIPLYKSDFQWENGQQDIDTIISLVKDWQADVSRRKVGHNLSYDATFLRYTEDVQELEGNQDTKVGWWLAVTQEESESLSLSTLAYEVTDMGGYDDPLENYKKWFSNELIKFLANKIKAIVSDNKDYAKKELDVKVTQYKKWLEDNIDPTTSEEEQYIKLGLTPESIDVNTLDNLEGLQEVLDKSEEYTGLSQEGKDYVIDTAVGLINKYKEANLVINEIDGSKFNYDWIPLELLHPYASGDTDVCRRIYCEVKERLKDKPKLLNLLQQDYPRLLRTLSKMSYNGLPINTDYALKNDEEYQKELERIVSKINNHWAAKEVIEEKERLYELGVEEMTKPPKERDKELVKYRDKYKKDGVTFNPKSTEDKGKLLFDVLGIELPYTKDYLTPKTMEDNIPENQLESKNYKTSKDTMKYVKKNYPEYSDIMELFLEYSTISTLQSTFTSTFAYKASDGYMVPVYNITGTACISGDSYLVTDKGLKQIQTLSNNREEGTFEDININVANQYSESERADGFYYSGIRDGLKITLEDGTELTTTTNHPLLKNNYYSNTGKVVNKNNQTTKHFLDNDWFRADSLKVGDYLKMSIGTEMYGEYQYFNNEGYEYSKYRAKTNTKPYKLPIKLDEDLAEWYGMYIADGSYSTNNGSFGVTLTNSKDEVRTRFCNLTKKLFNIEATDHHSLSRSDYVLISSVGLGRWLVKTFDIKTSALEKEIPQSILESPKTVQQAFIRGLSLDSATEKKKYPSLYFNTASIKMAKQLRAILLNMGIYNRASTGKAYKRKDRNKSNPCYSTQITYDMLEKYLKEIGMIETVKKERLEYKIKNYPAGLNKREGIKLFNNIYLGKIARIEEVANVEFFDLHVPQTHSFTANGLVNHNTSRLSSRNPKSNVGVVKLC